MKIFFSLTYEEAKNLEHKLYQEYAADLLLKRSLEIENKLISIENLNLKYHIRFLVKCHQLAGVFLFLYMEEVE